MSKQFSTRLLAWFEQHARHDLPWQIEQTPYRVWISEIMLQQTQVVTVIPYFERFIKEFPNVEALAKADLDNVLHLWTGLGYYARARNLYKAAKIIVEDYKGKFPSTLKEMMALPGIGRSTAGAILSLASEKRHPILDGNVKRVLSRYHGIEGWPGKKQVEEELWSYAESYTPSDNLVKDYTQAIMDLGATVCVRRNPDCQACPFTTSCFANKKGRQHDFPGSKLKKVLPKKETVFAIIENSKGEVLLQQRPPTGIWGGLWCFPEFSSSDSIISKLKKYGFNIKHQTEFESFKHTFSHFHLMIKPVHIKLRGRENMVHDEGLSTWVNPANKSNLGFPAPVVSMLKDLNNLKGGIE